MLERMLDRIIEGIGTAVDFAGIIVVVPLFILGYAAGVVKESVIEGYRRGARRW